MWYAMRLPSGDQVGVFEPMASRAVGELLPRSAVGVEDPDRATPVVLAESFGKLECQLSRGRRGMSRGHIGHRATHSVDDSPSATRTASLVAAAASSASIACELGGV